MVQGGPKKEGVGSYHDTGNPYAVVGVLSASVLSSVMNDSILFSPTLPFLYQKGAPLEKAAGLAVCQR